MAQQQFNAPGGITVGISPVQVISNAGAISGDGYGLSNINGDNVSTVPSATNAASLVNGSWSIVPNGTKLEIRYNNVAVASFDTTGAFISANNVTGFGTP